MLFKNQKTSRLMVCEFRMKLSIK